MFLYMILVAHDQLFASHPYFQADDRLIRSTTQDNSWRGDNGHDGETDDAGTGAMVAPVGT
jgi:hypothetical protein